jgi:dTDP-4-amino-4,6-dideoxygalactose transaminase
MIPLVDLKAQVATLRAELDAAMRGVVDETAFILGPAVEKFEKAFARYIGVKHCVCVNSGTAALQLALMAAGVGRGDEVLTSPASFFASAEAISLAGATPLFCDVEPDTLNLDPARIAAALTPRTRAIVPVHLYGQAADMKPILELARARNLVVIEDACQAHGASYRLGSDERRCGALGLAGAFSFYPGKNLGAFGEGGAVTTDDDALAQRVRLLRDHGSPEKYRHSVVGYNYRMEGLQGAVLGVKLPHLDRWNAARARLARRYGERLRGVGDLQLPVERDHGRACWHLYAVRTAARDRVFTKFAAANIARAIHYPIPIHLQEAYAGLGHRAGAFPVTEEAAGKLLSLPLYPELTDAQQDQVIDAVQAAFT